MVTLSSELTLTRLELAKDLSHLLQQWDSPTRQKPFPLSELQQVHFAVDTPLPECVSLLRTCRESVRLALHEEGTLTSAWVASRRNSVVTSAAAVVPLDAAATTVGTPALGATCVETMSPQPASPGRTDRTDEPFSTRSDLLSSEAARLTEEAIHTQMTAGWGPQRAVDVDVPIHAQGVADMLAALRGDDDFHEESERLTREKERERMAKLESRVDLLDVRVRQTAREGEAPASSSAAPSEAPYSGNPVEPLLTPTENSRHSPVTKDVKKKVKKTIPLTPANKKGPGLGSQPPDPDAKASADMPLGGSSKLVAVNPESALRLVRSELYQSLVHVGTERPEAGMRRIVLGQNFAPAQPRPSEAEKQPFRSASPPTPRSFSEHATDRAHRRRDRGNEQSAIPQSPASVVLSAGRVSPLNGPLSAKKRRSLKSLPRAAVQSVEGSKSAAKSTDKRDATFERLAKGHTHRTYHIESKQGIKGIRSPSSPSSCVLEHYEANATTPADPGSPIGLSSDWRAAVVTSDSAKLGAFADTIPLAPSEPRVEIDSLAMRELAIEAGRAVIGACIVKQSPLVASPSSSNTSGKKKLVYPVTSKPFITR
jgi:hypothetical protein